MRLFVIFVMVSCTTWTWAQSWSIQVMPNMPEPISNNAVCEGFIGDTTFIFSFAGLDSTKTHNGIHLRSYRFNTTSMLWHPIPDLPDTMGKIAPGASRINDTIYIMGGYHVLPSSNEVSSNKVHRYQISSNSYLSDGADIPTPIDDHVQAVWNDSLIFCITGWSNSGNTNRVQIYNPFTNTWAQATTVPNSNYRLFGAGGTIINNTIYYYGGARSSFNFPAGIRLLIGEINPTDPTQIIWSDSLISSSLAGYRCAGTSVSEVPYFIGGSDVTYNYDGIAYNGSGGVVPNNRIMEYIPSTGQYFTETYSEIPMDLRSVASPQDSVKYIAGGMLNNQTVTSQFIKLTRLYTTGINPISQDQEIKVYPNPVSDNIFLPADLSIHICTVINLEGKIIKKYSSPQQAINVAFLTPGVYFLLIETSKGSFNSKFIKN